MKFKSYVASLNKYLEENPEFGDSITIYSSDDEGNTFHTVKFVASEMFANDPIGSFEAFSKTEIEEEDMDQFTRVICIN